VAGIILSCKVAKKFEVGSNEKQERSTWNVEILTCVNQRDQPSLQPSLKLQLTKNALTDKSAVEKDLVTKKLRDKEKW
jgi:hypothetical protein